jgi:hypothetical protein
MSQDTAHSPLGRGSSQTKSVICPLEPDIIPHFPGRMILAGSDQIYEG